MRSHGPWRIVSSRVIYEDPWLRLDKDDVLRPDGTPGTYSVVHIKCGVSVLALDAEDNVYLTEEFHYAVGRLTLETVSGGIDPGEGPLQTAKRELKEELGLEASEWIDMGMVDPLTGSLETPTGLYLARGLTIGEASPEGTEEIRCVRMPLAEAVQAVMDGRITHCPSCVLIFKTWHRLRA